MSNANDSKEDITRRITWFENALADADKSFDYWLNKVSYLASCQSEEMARQESKTIPFNTSTATTG